MNFQDIEVLGKSHYIEDAQGAIFMEKIRHLGLIPVLPAFWATPPTIACMPSPTI